MKKMFKNKMWHLIIVLFSMIVIIINSVGPIKAINIADNGVNYGTYTISSNGLVDTQDAYIVKNTVTKFQIKNTNEYYTLVNPLEMYYDSVGQYIYVVEGGGKIAGVTVEPSILRISKDLSEVEVIKYDSFNAPQGVFVVNKSSSTDDDMIYVADYGAQKVFVLDFNGTLIREYSKPDHPLYGGNMKFTPSKIVVDHVGTMYIQDAGNTNGLVQLTDDGEFLGYFGANYTTPDMEYIIRFMFATDEQREKLYRQPISPVNMAIDNDGLINTVTKNNGPADSVKRLNIAGTNLLNPQYPWASDSCVDITIGAINNIYTIDQGGWIYEYDVNGDLLFIFGGPDNSGSYIGLFKDPKSIIVDENYQLYVCDNGQITVFIPTQFCNYVHEAIYLYQNGLYAKSREPWENVLQLNNMFDLAHRGIGKAFLIEQDYEQALYHFELAGDTAGYSEAYWELRNKWLEDNLGIILVISLIVVASVVVIRFLDKKNITHVGEVTSEKLSSIKDKLLSIKFIEELKNAFSFIRHPLNGFYEVKKHNAVSPFTATILYLVLFIELVLAEVFTGFIFNPIDVEQISVISIFTSSILIILLFAFCHYLIASIVEGNGTLKNVYCATICSFTPVIVFLPVIVIISNFITLNEEFIYTFGTTFIWGWSFILMFFMVKDIQELEVGETIANILLTAVTMILFVAFGFLLFAIGEQIVTFIKEVIMEVISNG